MRLVGIEATPNAFVVKNVLNYTRVVYGVARDRKCLAFSVIVVVVNLSVS